ncbi:unnamed protein product [Ophioblennius macclurei]
MAAECLTTLTEKWIRDRLQLKHPWLGDVRTLSLPGTYEEKIVHLGHALNNFVRLKSLDLSCNALVNVQGVQHLKMLERLILYNNCIPSLEEIKVLFELPSLQELDLRLNPLTKSYPHYRPYLVHAMPNLRKLDSCSVRDTERKVAILQFSSDLVVERKKKKKNASLNPTEDQRVPRSSNQRLALVDRITKRFSPLTDSHDIVLNFIETNTSGQRGITSDSPHEEAEESRDENIEDFTEQRSSTPIKESAKSILRYPSSKNDNAEFKGPHVKKTSNKKSSTSSKVAEKPKVSFGPYVDKQSSVPADQSLKDSPKRSRHAARGHFTPNPDQSRPRSASLINIRPPSPRRPGLNLSDPSDPVLHPPRLTYSRKTEEGSSLPQQADKMKRGSYRKPLEMLLNLVDKHWKGEKSLHHNNNFLSQAVQILSMMESDISSREAEVRTLRREADGLKFQAAAREEEHKTEMSRVSAQLEEARSAVGKLNEQLRVVLEENVALQKQLIKLERQYLKSMMKSSPISQIREAQTEVDELKKEIEGLRKKVQESEKDKELSNILQESHRSLVATSERLLAELKENVED